MTKKTEALTPAQRSQQALSTAINAADIARVQVERLAASVALHDRKIGAADTSVDLAEGARSRIMLHDAEALAVACERRVSEARRSLRTDDPTLAEALAPIIAKITGAPVRVVVERPENVPETLPLATVVQTKPTERDLFSGRISGRVVIHYQRSALHVPAADSKVENALRDAGVLCTVREDDSYSMGEDDVIVDRLVIEVSSCWPAGLPEIIARDFTRDIYRELAQSVAARCTQRLHVPSRAARIGVRTGATGDAASYRANVTCSGSASLVSDRTDDGERVRTVEVVIQAHLHAPSAGIPLVVNTIKGIAGECAESIGRIEHVEILETAKSAVRARITLRCKLAEQVAAA